MSHANIKNWVIKQNIIKNLTVVLVTVILVMWARSYANDVGDSSLDVFVFLSIFPLGAMFGYFAFSYAETNLRSPGHRALADLTTLIFLIIICFTVSFSTMLGILAVPQLTLPFLMMAILLISGVLVYDFWNLYSNLEKSNIE